MSINDRISYLMQEKNLSANEFAARLGVRPSNISHLITGRNKPSFSFLEKFAAEFPEISTDWLLKGEGPVYIYDREDRPDRERSLFDDEKPVVSVPVVSSKAPKIERIIVYLDNGSYEEFLPNKK